MKVVFMSVKKATLSILSGAFWSTSGEQWIGPRIFDVWGLPKTKKLKIAKAEAEQIIANSQKIYNGILNELK